MIPGFVLLLLSLFLWLVGTHVREGRWFDRPVVARNRLFDPLLAIARWIVLATGLLLLWRAAPSAAAIAAGALLALAAWRRVSRSAWRRGRDLRRRLADLRAARPGLPEDDALRQAILERHPEWGGELVEQMIADYRTPEALAGVMARMERGFRGFRP